jgi:hypothetical protein
MNELIWPGLDDIGYEFRRESLLELGYRMTFPAVRWLVPPARCHMCRSRLARCFCPVR